ncbi:MAG: tRNA (adenosine(37)-N6)-dimethylallyltransferase MiaA [Clostridia bacterium]|nr:tRNA (adenosine(37)-N6)-dimethylallyltransferase MiaA [Clostridia bacterium]
MKKILIITGLTATGKSGFAIDCALKYNGEIISCDSVQIFKGLDIGSNKNTEIQNKGVKHHLIDALNPNEEYSVGQFVKDCKNFIDKIEGKNKLPIITGGTGLYVKALINGYNFANFAKNDEFRNTLLHYANEYGNEYVWKILNEFNPDLAKTVHFNNLKRVIRYIEIEKFGNKTTKNTSILSKHNVLILCLTKERKLLYDQINKRVDEMINAGLVEEVKNLLASGVDKNAQSLTAIGYKEIVDYFSGIIPLERAIELIKQHTRNYAKRQLTFMKQIENIKIVDVTNNYDEATKHVEKFLKEEEND